MKVRKVLVAALLLGSPAVVVLSLYGALPSQICKRERLNERCNLNQDCCEGNECDAFGYCVPKRAYVPKS